MPLRPEPEYRKTLWEKEARLGKTRLEPHGFLAVCGISSTTPRRKRLRSRATGRVAPLRAAAWGSAPGLLS